MEMPISNYSPRLAKGWQAVGIHLDLGQEEDPYDYYYDDPDNLENPALKFRHVDGDRMWAQRLLLLLPRCGDAAGSRSRRKAAMPTTADDGGDNGDDDDGGHEEGGSRRRLGLGFGF
uniref:Uncharacterized protein n=1 Tax=Oryza sativa subsp. japonica TaxID=39947 RepID=Q6YZB4_ORYSJ|nr:hypothetical protein [Oryza sativa Japonica Group]BAD05763.1 hypothetical protein [Oryza sativa Japonica Group]